MEKQNILDAIKSHRLYFDGGTGTVLQKMGLGSGEAPELWNLSESDKIISLHEQYIAAGCNIIKTNTFGINKDKYPDNHRELATAAVDCAKKAIASHKVYSQSIDDEHPVYIAYDIGPTGRMLAPMGELAFEDAVAIFAENARLAEELGCDLILIETMNDSYETKAAVLAAKENSALPVFVTNAYSQDGKLMTGATPEAMVALLEGMGVDALGVNCSCGPDKMLSTVESLSKCSSLPIIVNPNAGLPVIVDGKTHFNIDPKKFAEYMVEIAKSGGCILGGCCGTTPEHIAWTVKATRDLDYTLPEQKNNTVISSYTHTVEIGAKPILIGERINPTGKPLLKDALRAGDINYVLNEAVKQADKGVHVLDVNVGLPDINESEMIVQAVAAIQAVLSTPLQLDSSNPKALGAAARIYNGKPLINSVNGKKESMEAVFPIAKKYSGAIIALTMDESGIPSTASGRVAIAEKIITTAKGYGIDKKDIIVDPLALTISSDTGNALVTLEAIALLHNKGIKTSLGVSNISFGLPQRDKINAAFFANALSMGLDCAIMNPFSQPMTDSYYAYMALNNMDENCSDYIAYATQNQSDAVAQKAEDVTLEYCIAKGLTARAQEIAAELAKTNAPLDIINTHVIPALNTVGEAFEQKKIFLPQLLASAQCACTVIDDLKALMPKNNTDGNKRIILATVRGDIHDIGKNIVKVMLESYGFSVIDLGKDITPEAVLAAVKETGCKLVGLSALMTTTVPAMEETISLLHSADSSVRVITGGAVLTQDYADKMHSDCYAEDAMDTVRYAQEFYRY